MSGPKRRSAATSRRSAAARSTASKKPKATAPELPSSLNPTECLPYVINVLTNYVNETMHEDLRRVGMTVPRWTVLSALRDENGLAIGDLASRCMIRQSSLTRVVDQLERDGHVRRRASRGDQRVVQVYITKAGNDLYSSVVPGAVERASSEIRGLLSTEVDALAGVLERAADALKGKSSRKSISRPRRKKAAKRSTA